MLKKSCKKVIGVVFVITMFVGWFTTFISAQSHTFEGRVIDKKGNPVKGVKVVVDPVIKDEIDLITFSGGTNNEGYFSFKENIAKERTVVYLSFSPPPIAFTAMPIKPPFYKLLPRLSKQLKRKRVVLSSKDKTDVGTIVVDFPYTIVNLNIVNAKEDTDLNNYGDRSILWLSIFTKDGIAVSTNNFQSLNGAIGIDSDLSLALPTGKWRVKVCKDDSCKGVLVASKLFTVGKKEINIKLNKVTIR